MEHNYYRGGKQVQVIIMAMAKNHESSSKLDDSKACSGRKFWKKKESKLFYCLLFKFTCT